MRSSRIGLGILLVALTAKLALAQSENFSVGEFSHREVDYKSTIDGFEIVRVNPLVFDSSQSFEYGTAKQTGWEWDFETRASPAYSILPGINIMSLGRTMPLNYGSAASGSDEFNAQRGHFFRYSYLNGGFQQSELVDLQTDTRLTFKEVMIAQDSYRSMLLQSKTLRDGTTFNYEYSTTNWSEGLICPNITIRHVPSNATLVVKRSTPWQMGIDPNFALDHCLPTEVTLPNGVSKIFYNWTAYPITATRLFPLLSSVQYPDGSLKTYNYQPLTELVNGFTVMRPGLTFVTDEEGKRVVTYEWQNNKVVSSYYGNSSAPKNKVSVVENADGSRVVTDAAGISRTVKMAAWEKQVGPASVKPVKFKRFAGMSSPCQWCEVDFKDIKYNITGLVTQTTDQRGIVTQINRNESTDTLQREVSRVVGAGTAEAKTTTTQYDGRFNLPTKQVVSDGSGSYTTETSYDAVGRPIRIAYSQSAKLLNAAPVSVTRVTNMSYTLHPNGQVKTMVVDGPRSDVNDMVVSTFDTSSVLTSLNDATGITTFSLHDWNGRPQRITYPNGTTTTFAYDWAGRVLSSTTAGVTTTNTYYKNGFLKTSTTPGTSENTTYTYDDANRLTRTTDAVGNRVDYSYDALGRPTAVKAYEPNGALSTSQLSAYDNGGRTIARTSGSISGVHLTKLNENFDVIQSTDPLLKATSLTRDALGRVKSSVFAGLNSSATFDVADNLNASSYFASGSINRNQAFNYVSDAVGNVVNANDSDTGMDFFSLNEAGDVTQATNTFGGHRFNQTRDALGRVTKATYSHGTTGALLGSINYGYDVNPDGTTPAPTGKLTSISGTFGTVQFYYDGKGLLKKKTQSRSSGLSKTDSYLYDGAGRVTQLTYPSGREVKMTLDGVGRPSAITTRANASSAWTAVADSITYPPIGGLSDATSMRFGGTTQLAKRQFDSAGRVSAFSEGVGATLVSVTRRSDGQVSSLKVGSTVNATYDYDERNRLKSATGTGFTATTYTYEATGDLVALKEGTVTYSGTYFANSSRLASIAGVPWAYTQDGLVASTGDIALTYDARGFVATAKKAAGLVTSYTYDALGQRMSKKTGTGAVTDFAYDAEGRLIAEFNPATGVTSREYIWLGDRPIMLVIPAAVEARYFIYTDYSNTPIRLTDAVGTTVWQWKRDPFGKVAPSISTVTFNLRMPGQYFDVETGLHYNNARYYHPATGRYLQADPVGETAGVSAYTYADGDAVNLVDPSGLSPDYGGIPESEMSPPITIYGERRFTDFGGRYNSSSFESANVYGGSGNSPFDPQGINFVPPAEFLPPSQVANTKVTGAMAVLTNPEFQSAAAELGLVLATSRIPGLGKLLSFFKKAPIQPRKGYELKGDLPKPGESAAVVLEYETKTLASKVGEARRGAHFEVLRDVLFRNEVSHRSHTGVTIWNKTTHLDMLGRSRGINFPAWQNMNLPVHAQNSAAQTIANVSKMEVHVVNNAGGKVLQIISPK